jgi:hypothetical protein
MLVAVVLVLLAIGVWERWRDRSAPVPATTAGARAPASEARLPDSSTHFSPPATRDSPPATRDAGRYDLSADESRGGHTLARHVGRSDADLLERLDRERNISAASTYDDQAVAERTVARTIARNQRRIDAWIARGRARPNLALDYDGPADEPIGRSIARGRRAAVACSSAVVVLRAAGPDGFIVLTSYPEAPR